jgi:hypothetical protein
MNHRDAEIADIVVVLNECHNGDVARAVQQLAAAGVMILNTDEENKVIEGSIETFKLPDLHKIECVNYVRTVLTYIADYPVGDPRDTDLSEDDEDGEDAA